MGDCGKDERLIILLPLLGYDVPGWRIVAHSPSL